MAALNKYECIGRLGKDPDMNYTPGGQAVTKFSIAVDQGKDSPAMWLDIVCWEKLAELMNQFLYKGALVYVEGRLQKRTYSDKQGVERLAVDIVASNIQLLSPARKPGTEGEEALTEH